MAFVLLPFLFLLKAPLKVITYINNHSPVKTPGRISHRQLLFGRKSDSRRTRLVHPICSLERANFDGNMGIPDSTRGCGPCSRPLNFQGLLTWCKDHQLSLALVSFNPHVFWSLSM
ncbi:hypothetical protein F5Y19DRAFT_433894 [Xylariaceae sp. FL1651]|nr:hypothetical protein F5Y19DRAFT_433894 [Xylariaceae sp. FL1651]